MGARDPTTRLSDGAFTRATLTPDGPGTLTIRWTRDPALPAELERTASLDDVVMAVRHRALPAQGVQFHPESVLTPDGRQLLANFLAGPRSS